MARSDDGLAIMMITIGDGGHDNHDGHDDHHDDHHGDDHNDGHFLSRMTDSAHF